MRFTKKWSVTEWEGILKYELLSSQVVTRKRCKYITSHQRNSADQVISQVNSSTGICTSRQEKIELLVSNFGDKMSAKMKINAYLKF